MHNQYSLKNGPHKLPQWIALGAALAILLTACSDDVPGGENQLRESDCAEDESWNPIHGICQPNEQNENDDVGVNSGNGDEEDAFTPPVDECGPDGTPTAITGVVNIPSGELPLPDVNVYVPPPHAEIAPFTEGATCEPCGQGLSVNPMAEDTTNVVGEFRLTGVPTGEDIPLVVEIGKWRRQATIPYVAECEETAVDPELTRLPRNREEGELPKFAVTTGECDALECLLRKIGIDDSEFTAASDDGAVHLFAGQGGSNSFEGGGTFDQAWPWWDDADNLLNYDIIAHSCECSEAMGNKSDDALDALLEFTEAGGRVFLSHYHYAWLKHGPHDFKQVADWFSMAAITGTTEAGLIDTSFPKGQLLREWMYRTGTEPAGEFPINQTRGSIESINEDYATQWVWIESEGMDLPGFGGIFPDPPPELVQYFSFNSPVGAAPDNQCGRVVFSDIHVVGSQSFTPGAPFPSGCPGGALTPQEKALVFMMFDLSRCIIPDKGSFAGGGQ